MTPLKCLFRNAAEWHCSAIVTGWNERHGEAAEAACIAAELAEAEKKAVEEAEAARIAAAELAEVEKKAVEEAEVARIAAPELLAEAEEKAVSFSPWYENDLLV